MKHKNKILFLTTAVCVFFTPLAQASYVNSCELQGKVVSWPETVRAYLEDGTDREETRFDFRVLEAKDRGRADSDCDQFKSKTLPVVLNSGTPEVKAIKKRDRLKLHYMQRSPTKKHSFDLMRK